MAALGEELVSRIVGYKITKGDFRTSSPNLPQRVVILGEANTANQSGLSTDALTATTLQQIGNAYGYGSPIYHTMRILRPISGGGIGGIPIVVLAQAAAGGSVAKVMTIEPSGTATANGTHTIYVAGRAGIDGQSYDINIESGDDVSDITAKIETAINNVLGAPVIASEDSYEVTLTAKWTGLTSNDLTVTVDDNGNDLGITYTIATSTAGSGTPSIAAALATFGNDWNTIIINTYGTVSAIMTSLESVNGIPDPTTPTGRYAATVFKPFIALTGSVADDPSSITDARLNNVTIAICPAPLSAGFPFEAAANMGVLFANTSQNTPHLDVCGSSYPDMPTPLAIGSMATYTNRDTIVKKGCSTVDLVGGKYQVQDFVTTYHPLGELPPQFRYCRNLMLDWNVRYGYFLLEQINVVDHVIADDNDTVRASRVIKPKQWKALLFQYADDLTLRGLVVQPTFMQESITVSLSTSNPDRLEVFFRYKRSGVARIVSTVAEAGFNFGTL